ncbi:hypothetical protein [Delftia lacustris]|uniref:hypothetical protein n=1 Tax=Delftia lacustris TaxID=558537 RepID=UPI001EF06FF2|nr:hypothetical protein [Delftia lacustris]
MAWLLVWSIALAPLLGQMHRVVHAGGLASASASATATATATAHGPVEVVATSCAAPVDWVHALFSGHGPADCQLLDQLHEGMAGPPPAVALPPFWGEQAEPAQPPIVRDGRVLAAFFDARGPPHPITARLAA